MKRIKNRSGGEKQWLTEKRDGALGTWRFRPIYCLLDSISIFLTLFSLVVLDLEPASKRRILASLIRAMTVLQYVKMISMQGTSIVVLETQLSSTTIKDMIEMPA